MRQEPLDRRGGLLYERSYRGAPAEAPPGGERVGGVPIGRVVRRKRGRQAPLRPVARALLQRLARNEDHAGAQRGGAHGGMKAGGAGADYDDLGRLGLAGRGHGQAEYGTRATTSAPVAA